MNLFKRWLVIMAALFVAALIVPGIHVAPNSWVSYAVMAAVLALLNAILLPILKGLSCGLIVLTLGIFSLVLNAAVFMLASSLSKGLFNIGFTVDGFLPALLASIIVSIATTLFAGERRKISSNNNR
ncbi:MAG TPA: phage holin family protein [Anaerolineaceae bacterium]|nr:phage holin family protein [Anaerolineaceae bacterium]